MSTPTTFHVGQEVWVWTLYRRDSEPRRAVVTKVGRTLVTVETYGQFYMDTGYAKSGQYAPQHRIETDEQRGIRERYETAVGRLRELRVRVEHDCKLSTDQLEAMVAAIGEAS